MNNSKRWSICFLAAALLSLILIGSLTVVVDPYFHYHGPLEGLEYPLTDERYQNDGISRHFSYDAIITGTSMTENFKASECDALFGVNAIKTSFSGGTNKEIGDYLTRAIAANPDIRLIIRGIDGWTLTDHKDYMRTDAEFPTYLYDDRLFNDVRYVLNKSILFQNTFGVLSYTRQGYSTTTFDAYSNWHDMFPLGAEAVKATYPRPEKNETVFSLTPEEAQTVRESVLQNMVQPARENPDIQFYYFFTPYSILHMDRQDRQGILNRQFEIYILTSNLLLQEKNIRLFSFFDDYGMITDLNNYSDVSHYSEDINSLILQRMVRGEYRLTEENYLDHWEKMEAYYSNYPYDIHFEEQ